MAAYYNEIEPFAVHVLRQLIRDGVIADGDVDDRSIADVRAEDLKGYAQCHFFAGGGLWSVALRLAGWDDDRPVWTGSCPCQPFSVAGKGKGTADERHLWPDFLRLIRSCRPTVVVGEQVAGKAGYGWFDGVRTDLEGEGYASRGVDIPACAVNAPHIRQRLYWVATNVADAEYTRRNAERLLRHGEISGPVGAWETGATLRRSEDASSDDMADADGEQLRGGHGRKYSGSPGSDANETREREWFRADAGADGDDRSGDMADANSSERRAATEGRRHDDDGANAGRQEAAGGYQFHRAGDVADADDARREGRDLLPERPGERSPWSNGVEWRRGADGKERRVKSGICLLVDGIPGRVGQLRLAGNAIVPQVAAEVIKALM